MLFQELNERGVVGQFVMALAISGVAFPLTPALSLGEREKVS